MKVLVINAYVREQGGDAALLSVILGQLKEAYPKAEIEIAGMENPKEYSDFEGVKNIGSIRHYTSVESLWLPHRLARRVLSFFVGGFWFKGPEFLWKALSALLPGEVRSEIEAIRNADLVVGVGGGYLNGKNDLGGNLNVYYLLLPARLATRLGKPVVFAPQSYGVFGNAKQEKWTSQVFQNASLILAREQPSVDILLRLGIDKKLIHKIVDSGFAFSVSGHSKVLESYGVKAKEPIVGITAKKYLAQDKQEKFEKELAKAIDYIQAKYGFKVVMIPQVTSSFQADDDRIVAKRIAGYCNLKPFVIDEKIEYQKLKALYDELNYLIGTRFHSVIFGLTSYVPSIAIEYEHKTGGIMHDLKLDDWVIKMQDVTEPKLSKMFDRLVFERKNYLNHLQKFLPPYIELAKSTPSLIKKALSKNASHASKR